MKLTLKAARVNAGLTQKDAANLLKVHPQTLAKWETDNSKMPFAKVKLAEQLYGVDEGVIFLARLSSYLEILLELNRRIGYERIHYQNVRRSDSRTHARTQYVKS